MAKSIRKTLRAIARIVGFEIEAYRDASTYGVYVTRIKHKPALPVLVRDAIDALHHVHGQKPASFECRIDRCVDLNGLAFSDRGWHPFSAALTEYAAGSVTQYEGCSLERYYDRWQPKSLREALFGAIHTDNAELHELPGHLLGFFPWCARTAQEAEDGVRARCHRDGNEHGHIYRSAESDGFKTHGPMSPEAGRFEHTRLVRVYDSLAANGYDREHGDIGVLMVRREGEHRFIVYNGMHRVAAMKALGHTTVPAMLSFATVFDVADVEAWPQVSKGVWSRISAENYVAHLFDFDSHAWATEMGLT